MILEIVQVRKLKQGGGRKMALINLKKEMAGADVSVEAVAALLGIHRNTVSNKIDGASKITFEEALKIRKKFFPKLGLEYLFKDVEP
jgi:hypothetical protein